MSAGCHGSGPESLVSGRLTVCVLVLALVVFGCGREGDSGPDILEPDPVADRPPVFERAIFYYDALIEAAVLDVEASDPDGEAVEITCRGDLSASGFHSLRAELPAVQTGETQDLAVSCSALSGDRSTNRDLRLQIPVLRPVRTFTFIITEMTDHRSRLTGGHILLGIGERDTILLDEDADGEIVFHHRQGIFDVSYRDERHDGSLQAVRLAAPLRAYGERLGITWSVDPMRVRVPDADSRLELFAARTDFDRALYRRILSSSQGRIDHPGYCDSLPPGGTRRTPYEFQDVAIVFPDDPDPPPGPFRDLNRSRIREALNGLSAVSLPEVRVRTGGLETRVNWLEGPAIFIDNVDHWEHDDPLFPWHTWTYEDPWGCIRQQGVDVSNLFPLSPDEALELALMTTLGARGGDSEFPAMVAGGTPTALARAAVAVHEALGPDAGLFR
ncbi:MAG TPA: hypothetical protein VFM44_06735 [Gemmatimonadota bacterium]|nr:hypothetical protein [Gemmatimonadota bacterium]